MSTAAKIARSPGAGKRRPILLRSLLGTDCDPVFMLDGFGHRKQRVLKKVVVRRVVSCRAVDFYAVAIFTHHFGPAVLCYRCYGAAWVVCISNNGVPEGAGSRLFPNTPNARNPRDMKDRKFVWDARRDGERHTGPVFSPPISVARWVLGSRPAAAQQNRAERPTDCLRIREIRGDQGSGYLAVWPSEAAMVRVSVDGFTPRIDDNVLRHLW
jgi:hypothetical protein